MARIGKPISILLASLDASASDFLRDCGNFATVAQVAAFSELERHLAARHVDIIVLDCDLPNVEGVSVVRRTTVAYPDIPVVVLAENDQEKASKALRDGALDYLTWDGFQGNAAVQFLRHIVERNELQEPLFVERERARMTLLSIGDAVATTDSNDNIMFLNPVAEAITGWTSDAALGVHFSEVFEIRDAATDKRIPSPLGPGSGSEGREEIPPNSLLTRRGDGHEIPVEDSVATVFDRTGKANGSVIILRDITERLRAEEELRKSHSQFRKLFEANTIGILITNLSGRIYEANDYYLSLIGYSREEVLAPDFSWGNLTVPEERAHTRQVIDELRRTGKAQTWEREYVRKDGSRVPAVIGVAMLDASEETCITYVVDLSVRRKLQEQLRQSNKMEAIGQLAGGVAHDFNNALTVILSHSDLLAMSCADDDPMRASIDEIRAAAERAGLLTRQLLAYSRRQALDPKALDLGALIERLATMLRRLIGEDITLVTDVGTNSQRVLADEGEVGQIVMNLALNARDAMPGGGRLVIELTAVDLDESPLSPTLRPLQGSFAKLSVTDNGSGMSEETMSRAFEPFFTTKALGEGTGLGLAIAHSAITRSGGDIRVSSKPGLRTTFDVYLPCADEVDELQEAPKAPSPPEVRGETILLVEDEEPVRRPLRRILEVAGYTVLEATSGHAGIEIAREHPGRIDLVLTDVVMPSMGGTEMVAKLVEFMPDVRVIYMSGYTDNAVTRQGLVSEQVNFLQKPFTLQELIQAVRRVLTTAQEPN